jgi:nucleoside-diphosphate-sugar epimerase
LCNAVYVDDVANAMILAAKQKGAACENFIVSNAQPVTWRDYFESIADTLGVDSIEYVESQKLGGWQDRGLSKFQLLMGNPLVRKSINKACNMAGPGLIQGIKSFVFATRRRRRNMVYYPNPGEVELYTSKGRCSIEKAREQLGYEPAFDFAAGSRLTAEYIRKKGQSSDRD